MSSLISADYHTHTIFSHGSGTVEENVIAAIEKGLEIIGISDHGFRQIAHGISQKGFKKQQAEILQLREKYKGIKILSSIEANIVSTDGSVDIKEDMLEKLDYLIAGFHRTAVPWKIRDLFLLQFAALFAPRHAKMNMTEADVAAIEKNRLMFITHPGEYIKVDIERVADAAVQNHTIIEINNKHPMSIKNLQVANSLGCCFVLSSDAHRPEDVGNVERAYDAAMTAGIQKERIINLRKE